MLGTFVAGAYTGSYTKTGDTLRSLGLTEKGFMLRWTYVTDDVDNTDSYGQGTLIEQFYQGVNVWIGGIFKEYTQGTLYAVGAYQTLIAPTGVASFLLGTIGRAATNVGGPVVLTAVSGTPAASSPATLTAAMAIPDKGQQTEMLFGPTHRTIPFLFRIIPTTISSNATYFTTT